jgi:integrase-like protein
VIRSHQRSGVYLDDAFPNCRYVIRDHDRVYGEIFTRRFRAMGIRDRPIAPRSPWQNGRTERLIGSIRRECLDHVVVFGERHLRHLLLILYGVLQWRKNTPFPEQGCAGTAGCSGHRANSSDSNSRRITPSVCSDLISDRDRIYKVTLVEGRPRRGTDGSTRSANGALWTLASHAAARSLKTASNSIALISTSPILEFTFMTRTRLQRCAAHTANRCCRGTPAHGYRA